MRPKLPNLLCLFLLLCLTLPFSVPTDTAFAVSEAPLSFTLEAKDKAVEFFQPLAIRIVVRNTSQSSITLDTESLRLDAQGWHVAGSHGAWSTDGTGEPLETEDKPAGRIELAPGKSFRLLYVEQYPTFELLGPTRVGYKLTSTDAATKKLLPVEARAVSLDIPPTKLMTSVWGAASQTQREQAQDAFNEFLKIWAKTEIKNTAEEGEEKEEGRPFRRRLADDEFATKTLTAKC